MRIKKIDMIRSIIANREQRNSLPSRTEAKNSELIKTLKRDLTKEFNHANQSLFEKYGDAIFST